MSLTFGEKIKESRKSQNLTQKQLAQLIGAAHNSISDWENNKNKPDPDTIELLCGALKITPNYLLNTSEDDFSPREKQIIKKFRSLDSHGKGTVEIILEREAMRINKIKKQESYLTELEKDSSSRSVRLINYYYRLASAGTGQIVFDTPPTKRIAIPDIPKYKNVAYAIGVNGDSMKPKFNNGDTLLIEMTDVVDVGDIGIFLVDGNCYIKKCGNEELISLNQKHANIPMNENARCMGKVIDKLNETE